MAARTRPSWACGSGSGRDGGAADPGLRVSDAERAAVADRLSRHYSDGRLDKAEFDERLERAMGAKTHADLAGLFADLPDGDPAGVPAPPRRGHPRHRGHLQRFLMLVLVIVIVAAAGHALTHSYLAWLLIGLLAFVWLRRGSSAHRRL